MRYDLRITDPEGADEIWRAKFQAARDDFVAGKFPMTEAVFRATLYGLGYRGSEINLEVEHATLESQRVLGPLDVDSRR